MFVGYLAGATVLTSVMAHSSPLDSHRTLWMGDLGEGWTADFVANAYKHVGHEPVTIKMVPERHTGQVNSYGYCFVEFADHETARKAMLDCNGHVIHESDPECRFNLSFANDPRTPSIEYNLFANNLDSKVTDADLYQVFGHRYLSCRGAKVYRNQDGSSRCLGFIRFGDQTEQQMALVEMNHTVVQGKEITLKLAAAKQRLPRSHISQGQQPFLIQNESVPTANILYQQVPQQTIYAPVVQMEAPAELAPIYYPSPEEANEEMIAHGDVWWEELEESRWSLCVTDVNWSERQFMQAISTNRW